MIDVTVHKSNAKQTWRALVDAWRNILVTEQSKKRRTMQRKALVKTIDQLLKQFEEACDVRRMWRQTREGEQLPKGLHHELLRQVVEQVKDVPVGLAQLFEHCAVAPYLFVSFYKLWVSNKDAQDKFDERMRGVMGIWLGVRGKNEWNACLEASDGVKGIDWKPGKGRGM